MIRTAMGVAVVLAATAYSVSAQTVTTNLFDDFNGSSLDLTKWAIISGSQDVSVSSGLLHLDGFSDGGSPTVETSATFEPVANSSTEAYDLNVQVQNGWNNTFAGFSSLLIRNDQAGQFWYISTPITVVFNTGVSAPNGSSADFNILWTPTSVTFSISTNENSQAYVYSTNIAYTATSAMPVYLRDYSSFSRFDSVLVTSIPEPSAMLLCGLGMAALAWRRVRR